MVNEIYPKTTIPNVYGTDGISLEDKLKALSTAENITWKDLKTKRDSKLLDPGKWYRITNYETTVVEGYDLGNVRAVQHYFDIIVLALTNDTLSEECFACKMNNDTYFKNCNLNAWKIWYCLDNDNKRFGWAAPEMAKITWEGNLYMYNVISTTDTDVTDYPIKIESDDNFMGKGYVYLNKFGSSGCKIYVDTTWYTHQVFDITSATKTTEGKGVIYRMIDDNNIDMPFDFKNIQFKRFKLTSAEKWWSEDLENKYCIADINILPWDYIEVDEVDFAWCYALSAMLEDTSLTHPALDLSVIYKQYPFSGYYDSPYVIGDIKVEQNTLIVPLLDIESSLSTSTLLLPNNVFQQKVWYSDGTFGTNDPGVYDVKIGHCCTHNTFRGVTHSKIDGRFIYNIFGGNYCYLLGTNIGMQCYSNLFVGEGVSLSLIDNVHNSIFGRISSSDIKSGNACIIRQLDHSKFGKGVSGIGDSNTDLHIEYCTFGNYVTYIGRNTEGLLNMTGVTIGEEVSDIIFVAPEGQGVSFISSVIHNSCGSLYFTFSDSNDTIRYITVYCGTRLDESRPLTILAKYYPQFIALKSDETVDIWSR